MATSRWSAIGATATSLTTASSKNCLRSGPRRNPQPMNHGSKMASPPESERVLIFDFGSQYGQLIARRVREQNVFCQIVRHELTAERVRELKPSGIILSGG